ncbi:MAG: condensation domain-containing protein [Actinoplanes sp.]
MSDAIVVEWATAEPPARIRSALAAVSDRHEVLRAAPIELSIHASGVRIAWPASAVDLGCLPLLTRELAAALAGRLDGEPAPEYSLLADWRQALRDSPDAAPGLAYWQQITTRGRYPDWVRAAAAATPRHRVPVDVPAGTLDRLRELGELRPLLLTSWAGHLGAPCVVGVYVDGRTDPDLHDMVGPLGHYVPVWLDGDVATTAGHLARAAANIDTYQPDAGARFRCTYDHTRLTTAFRHNPPGDLALSVLELPHTTTLTVIGDPAAAEHHARRLAETLRAVAADGPAALRAEPLGEPARPRPAGRAGSAPETGTERLVAGVWAEVLGEPAIARDTDFFQIGGHSLAAVRVVMRVRTALDREVRVADLLARPTVRAFAAFLDEAGAATGTGRTLPAADPAAVTTYAPSHAQRRLWFVDQFISGGAAVYNVPLLLRVPRRLDWARCTAVWTAIAHRHEALRTTFGKHGGEPVAVVGQQPQIAFRLLDLRDSERPESALTETFEHDQDLRFDLENGPLTRITVAWLPDGSSRLFVNMHHIITDLWSTATLVREFIGGYLEVGEPPVPPRFQYADYARWEQEVAGRGEWAAHERYLLGELATPVEPLELPLDFPRDPVQQYPGAESVHQLPAALTERIAGFAAANGMTPFMVLLTGYLILLRRMTSADDIVVGIPVANRARPEFAEVIGFFVSTSFVRVDFRSCHDVRDLLTTVRDKCLRAFEYQDYPFDLLVSKARLDRRVDRAPLFGTMLAYQDLLPMPADRPEAADWTYQPVPDRTSKFDLSVTAWLTDGTLGYSLTYATGLFAPETIDSLARRFEMCLARLVEVRT